MKIVIFIGHFKTGSSSLQAFLSSNYLRMLRAGILYPSVESQGMARNLAISVSGQDVPTAGESLNIIEPHNALALKLKTEEDKHGVPSYYPNLPSGFQMLEMIENQMHALNPRAVVLCSEVFALFGLTEERKSIDRLAKRFAHHDVTLYCNLRRPDEYLSSWHRQRLKFGARLGRLSEGALAEYFQTAHFDQAKVLEGWIEGGFRNANLVVRNFDDVRAGGGSVKDFVNNSGVDFPDGMEYLEDQNPSVPSAFAEIGRRALHDLPREEAQGVVRWLTSAGRRVVHPPDNRIEVFGPENREALLERFRPVAARLDELTGKRPFYPDLDDIGRCRPVPDLEAARELLPNLVEDAHRRHLSPPVLHWLDSLAI